MPMQPYFLRVSNLAATCLMLAIFLTGCATKKNPLMDGSVPSASPTKPAAGEPATPSPPTTPSASSAGEATGVQTKREKRLFGIFRPYRPDIQQGNFVSQEMVAQLKAGMTQDQVVFLLGTPLLTDVFHSDRWDYAFRLQKGNGETTTSRVTVFFQDKLVSHFEGGDLPTEEDYLERIANKAKAANK